MKHNVKPYEIVKANLERLGYHLDVAKDDYKGYTATPMLCHDDEGYKYYITYGTAVRYENNYKAKKVHKSNPFSIENINLYLSLNNYHFRCISERYVYYLEPLQFVCTRCGTIFEATWWSIIERNPEPKYIFCPNCDRRTESLHALVLKQMFLHEYPDTIVEDKSFRNPLSGRICPTDIVNHRLKIAIEIQSEWHDKEKAQIKDKLKKQFWLDKGYTFYDPDIRDYTVIGMCQLFFDVDKIPDYIDMHYSDCLDARQIQNMLDEGLDIPEISRRTGLSVDRIRAAHHSGKITLPSYYSNNCSKPVNQYTEDHEFITYYKTVTAAARAIGGCRDYLQKILREGKHIYKGFYWEYKTS